MDKSNGELLELVSYYDDLTGRQADCIARMSRMIASQAYTIRMLKGDKLIYESEKQLELDMEAINKNISEKLGDPVEP